MSELSRMTSERPISPHLAHYRLEIGQSTSIMHRVTGIALAAGLPVLVWWMVTCTKAITYNASSPDQSGLPSRLATSVAVISNSGVSGAAISASPFEQPRVAPLASHRNVSGWLA